MFEFLENGIGLEVILWFQEHRTAWMASLSLILDALGNELGYVVLFGLIFWAINKRHGIRLIYALIMIVIVTFAIKDILLRPRPYVASDLVMPVFEAYGAGLPSGHTAFAVMIWGYIALWVRKGWMWAFAIFYMILQGVARMIAGVHFPHDVAVGAFLGVLVLAFYYPTVNRWSSFWNQQRFRTQITLAIFVPLILSIIVLFIPLDAEQTESYLTMLGLAIGTGIGAAVEPHFIEFELPAQWWRRIAHFVMGIVLVLLALFGLSAIFDLIAETGILAYILRIIRYGIVGFVAISFVPWLAIQLNLIHYQKIDPEAADAVA